MKKAIVVLLSVLMLFLVACNNQGNGNTKQTVSSLEDYFPFIENVHYKYNGVGNEYAEYETYVDYIHDGVMQLRTINPGTESVSVYTIEDGTLKQVYNKGEVYYRYDYTATSGTAEILIKEPIAVGTSWTLADGSTRSITAVDATVEVPYGNLKVLEVTTVGKDSTTKQYYAPGVGLIKSEFVSNEDTSSTVSSELAAVEENVSFKQTVKFYYPDFNNDRLVYLEKQIELNTNDDITDAFEEQLRKVPENSGLKYLMSQNTTINSIKYDADTAVVTVDFSQEFISDMNAGSSLEVMILDSVADTFGNYFQTNKVAITIEGKAYESGHMYFQAGEYLTADWQDISVYQK